MINKKIVYTKKHYINNIEVHTRYEFDSREEAEQFFKENNFKYPLSPKQWGLIKNLNGDTKREFTSEAEFSAYVKELQSQQGIKSAPAGKTEEAKDVPWDMDL